MKATTLLIVLTTLASAPLEAARVKVPKGREKPCGFRNYYAEREKPAPLMEAPLRQPAIARGPDGAYYLTGTEPGGGGGFPSGEAIRIWKSSDLENWTLLGTAFDFSPKNPGAKTAWWSQAVPSAQGGQLVRGVTAPEIHSIAGQWWIVYSIGENGVGLLKSSSGKPEGPYADHARLTHAGGSPSLFADDDGKVYLLWGEGFIAPLAADFSSLASEPRLLRCSTDGQRGDYPLTVGQRGFHLFKREGLYWLCAEEITARDQMAACDLYIASSASLREPFGQRRWMIPHAGQTTVFEGPGGKLYASYCGNDENSAFTDRAGVVPLAWETEAPHGSKTKAPWKFPRIAAGVHTERGAWEDLLPVSEKGMRDVTCVTAPDGYYYYSGSWTDDYYKERLPALRSKDLVNWEELTIATLDDLAWLTPESLAIRKEGKGLDDNFMDCELHYIKGTFYYIYALYDVKRANLAPAPEGKAHSGVRYMRSTSGKIEGPWEDMGPLHVSQGSFFEDDDGTVYSCSGRFGLGMMAPDMNGGVGKERWNVLPADGSHGYTDVGAYLRKIGGKHVYFSCGYAKGWWHEAAPPLGDDQISSYNFSYLVSATPTPRGPWSRTRLGIDYGGHGGIFQDRQGRWWAAFFGCEGSSDFIRHWWCPSGVVPLEVNEKNGILDIHVARELPSDFAVALRQKRAKK